MAILWKEVYSLQSVNQTSTLILQYSYLNGSNGHAKPARSLVAFLYQPILVYAYYPQRTEMHLLGLANAMAVGSISP